MLRLTTLGYPQISLDERPVTEFVSNKVVVLLCYLVLTQRIHARESLAGLFWGDMSDARALANLRQALHNLQKHLPDYFLITRETAGFNTQAPYWIDIEEFRRGIVSAAEDHDRLLRICEMYRGDFLEGIHFDQAPGLEAWLQTERSQVQTLYSSSLESLMKAQSEQGQWHAAIESAERLLLVEPWRESAHRQIMLARARIGDYAAALACFERCCRILNHELGINPAAETLRLYEQICHAQDRPRHNLPSQPMPMVGRESQQRALEALLRQPHKRLITVIGPGGVGKSRLAQSTARSQQGQFLNGVYYVALALVDDPEFIHFAIAQTLNLRFSNFGSSEDQLIAHIKAFEMLLVLDGFEHLDAGVSLVARILEQAPEIKILVTSRRKLNLQGENALTLDGLELPSLSEADPEVLSQTGSVRLFLQCADQHQAAILPAELPAIARICHLLDGSPLAIELAAALLPVIDCAGIIAEIEQNLDILAATRRDRPERHRSLRAVFDHSWTLLNQSEQQTLTRVAVFRGGFSLEAARQVAQAELQSLNSLITQSLLYVSSKPGETRRYDLHDILQHYADEALQADPALAKQVYTAHRTFYSSFVQQADQLFVEQGIAAALDTLEGELPNIRQCWLNAIAEADFAVLSRMMRVLHKFYEGRSWYQEGIALLEQGIRMTPPQALEDQHIYARLHAHVSGLYIRMGQLAQALELAEKSVHLFQTLEENDEETAFAFNIYGICLLYTGRFDEARRAFDRCASIYRDLGNARELLKPLTNLGSLCSRTGEHLAARAYLEEGLHLAKEVGDRRGFAHFLVNIGVTYHLMDEAEKAEDYYQEGLIVSREVAYPHVQIAALTNLAQIRIQLGKYLQAIENSEEGLQVAEQINDKRQLAICWKHLAIAKQALGHSAEARSAIEQALKVAADTRAHAVILEVLQAAGKYLMLQGKTHSAAEILQLVQKHPATEAEYRLEARALLEEMRQSIEEDTDEVSVERLIDAIIPSVLETI